MAEDYSLLDSATKSEAPAPAPSTTRRLRGPVAAAVVVLCIGAVACAGAAVVGQSKSLPSMGQSLLRAGDDSNSAIEELKSIAAEARAELCPIMGFAESICPGGSKPAVLTSATSTTPLPAQIGVGLDSQTRQLKLPVLQFGIGEDSGEWTDAQGRTFRVPTGVTLAPVDNAARVHTFVFDSVWHFEEHLNKESSAKPGAFVDGGAYSHSTTVLDEYKATFDSGVNSLVVLQELYPLYQLKPQRGSKPQLSKFFTRALNALPKAYDQEVYRTFIDIYGIKLTTSVVAGGMVESQSSVRRCLLNSKGNEYVSSQATLDFKKTFHHDGNGAEVRYTDRRVAGPQLTVVGGVVDKTDPSERIKSFSLSPVILKYSYDDYTGLIPDETIRSNVERAINEYTASQEQQRKKDEQSIRAAMEHRRLEPIPTSISPISSTPTQYSDGQGWNSGVRYFVGDFNADGRGDMMMRGGDGSLAVWASDGKKFVHLGTTRTGMRDDQGWNTGRYWVGDFNGDGATDLLARAGDGTVIPYISDRKGGMTALAGTRTGYSDDQGWLNGQRFFACDINGDNRMDLVGRGGNGSFKFWLSDGKALKAAASITTGYSDGMGWNSGFRYKAVDVNGDGKCDLVARGGDGSFTTWLSDGSKWVKTASIRTGYRDDQGWNMASRFYFADINGDGSVDFTARAGNGEFTTWLSDGKKFVYSSSTPSGWSDRQGWNSGQRYFCMDANADMRQDFILRAGDGTLITVVSTGDAFKWMVKDAKISSYQDDAGWNDGQRYFIMDVDGDCMSDLVTRNGAGTFIFNVNKYKLS